MGKNTKKSLVKLGSSEERGDHPAALMISEVFTLSLMEPWSFVSFGLSQKKNKKRYKLILRDLIEDWNSLNIAEFKKFT